MRDYPTPPVGGGDAMACAGSIPVAADVPTVGSIPVTAAVRTVDPSGPVVPVVPAFGSVIGLVPYAMRDAALPLSPNTTPALEGDPRRSRC